MRISNIRLNLSNITASGTDTVAVVNVHKNFVKDETTGQRTDKVDYIRLCGMAVRGETFDIKVPYSEKLDKQFNELSSIIDNYGVAKVNLKEPRVKAYAFNNNDGNSISGVTVTANGFEIEEELI